MSTYIDNRLSDKKENELYSSPSELGSRQVRFAIGLRSSPHWEPDEEQTIGFGTATESGNVEEKPKVERSGTFTFPVPRESRPLNFLKTLEIVNARRYTLKDDGHDAVTLTVKSKGQNENEQVSCKSRWL
jgi:hypothetical protein